MGYWCGVWMVATGNNSGAEKMWTELDSAQGTRRYRVEVGVCLKKQAAGFGLKRSGASAARS